MTPSNTTKPYGALSDREVDALIAERVCGWTWWAFVGAAYMVPDWNLTAMRIAQAWSSFKPWTSEEKEIDPTSLQSGTRGIHAPPHYSTSLDHAFEALRKSGFRWIVTQDEAIVHQLNDDAPRVRIVPGKEARAICEALLMATEASRAEGEV